jgi:cell division protein FtsL
MKAKLSVVLPVTAIAMMATGQVWVSHVRYETSLATSEAQKERDEIKREIHTLNLELANLTRPERLRKIAQNDLGMAPPHPMQVVRP